MAAGDEILEWKKAIEKAETVSQTDCEYDGWPLETVNGELHCPFCGRVY